MPRICRILVVEDNDLIQDLLERTFADEGYRFIIVSDGAAMRAALATDPAIDIAVMDIRLPGGEDGFALAEEVAGQGVPVILVSGDHRSAKKLEASGHRYLLKPFRMGTFLEIIDAVLKATKAQCERDPLRPAC